MVNIIVKKYLGYRNPVIHNLYGTVICVKNKKNLNASIGTRLYGLSSITTGSDAQVSILLDSSAKRGKLCGIIVGSNALINITVNRLGVTAEIVEGSCAEVNAEQDNSIPSGLGNTSLGIRG